MTRRDATRRTLGLMLAAALPALAPVAATAQDSKAALPKLTTRVAFPELRFDRPVALAIANDGSDLLYVVEQHAAKIWSFPNAKSTSDKQLFLELPQPISKDNEEGLLGLAFHPKYKENGLFYVYYSATNPRRSVVSAFRRSKDDPRKADPASEQVIWQSAEDPFGNHNGGCIEFGPDGFLYISLGDGGAANDPLKTGQNPRDFFGSILRIDVDHPSGGKAYGIPADNPGKRGGKFKHWAPEVYAIGIRNIWKFTFDRADGRLWAGDVGQNKWEEVIVVENGGNYGWNIREAFHPFEVRGNRPDPASPIKEPVAEYPHPELSKSERQGREDTGKSITGGYVYRGKKLPALEGVYVYGDYETGRIWGLRYNESTGKASVSGELIDLGATPKINIAAFGEDAGGEMYVLGFDGRIYELVQP